LIEHKKTFSAKQLGLKGGRKAKQDYIARLRRDQDQACEQAERTEQ